MGNGDTKIRLENTLLCPSVTRLMHNRNRINSLLIQVLLTKDPFSWNTRAFRFDLIAAIACEGVT